MVANESLPEDELDEIILDMIDTLRGIPHILSSDKKLKKANCFSGIYLFTP